MFSKLLYYFFYMKLFNLRIVDVSEFNISLAD